MITQEQARTRVGARVLFVHAAQRGRKDSYGILRGMDTDPERALVEFDYANGHVSHPLRELLVLVPDG